MNVRSAMHEQLVAEASKAIQTATGLRPEIARPIAEACVEHLWKNLAGYRVRFGKRSDVDDRLCSEYDGTNAEALCRRYKISRRTLFRRLKQAKLQA